MKKFFRILIIFLVLGGGGLGVYLIWQNFLRPAPLPPPLVEEKKAAIVVAPSLSLISSRPVSDYWVNRADNSIYYLTAEGEIYKILSDGEEEKVTSQTLPSFHEILPSPDGASAIFSFGYPFTPLFSVFKTSDASWQPLPEGTTSAAWNPQPSTTTSIAFLQTNPLTGASSLNVFSLADQKTREIMKLSQVDLDLEWVLPDTIYLKQRPAAQIPSSLWAIDLNLGKIDKKTKKPIAPAIRSAILDESGLMIKWSGDGSLGLKLTVNTARAASLYLIDNRNIVFANYEFITLPSKCLFQKTLLYCAIPDTIPIGTMLPDDYLKRKTYFLDSIYALDLSEPALSVVNVSGVFDGTQFPIDATRLEIRDNNLIFINRYDQKIYSLKLLTETSAETPAETPTEAAIEIPTE